MYLVLEDPVDVLYKRETVVLKVNALCAQPTLQCVAGSSSKTQMKKENERMRKHTDGAVPGTLFVTDYRLFFLPFEASV